MRNFTFMFCTAVLLLTVLSAPRTFASTEETLYAFGQNGNGDGSGPRSGLILDSSGNLYGTTQSGGNGNGYGTVFELSVDSGGTWNEKTLYSFQGADGRQPESSLIFDAAGNLYGTTLYGGAYGEGTIFELSPNEDGTWSEAVLYSFNPKNGGGGEPQAGLTGDSNGNLYGTAAGGIGGGVVFELAFSGGTWNESILYNFCALEGCTDGARPVAGLIFDTAGNLYGTTQYGGKNYCGQANYCGTVFELSPNGDGTWTEAVLHDFNGKDGRWPVASVVFDNAGNLFSTTMGGGGAYGRKSGTVFELRRLSNEWRHTVLYAFPLPRHGSAVFPEAGVVFDGVDKLYGTTTYGGEQNQGMVFSLVKVGGKWQENVEHSFGGTLADGKTPQSGLAVDSIGNLYGTTSQGGSFSGGVVYQVSIGNR
jgi:uncharacterized repeat protein (TIGR03803 family)